MIENMPRHAPESVTNRPSVWLSNLTITEADNDREYVLAMCHRRAAVGKIELGCANADFSRVIPICLDDMRKDSVPVTATAARPLPELRCNRRDDLVEHGPACPEK